MAPVVHEGAREREVLLPDGEWIETWRRGGWSVSPRRGVEFDVRALDA